MSRVDIEIVHVGLLVESFLGFPFSIIQAPVFRSFIIRNWKNTSISDGITMGHTPTQTNKYTSNQVTKQTFNLLSNHNQLTTTELSWSEATSRKIITKFY
jgi:hypothetical protein